MHGHSILADCVVLFCLHPQLRFLTPRIATEFIKRTSNTTYSMLRAELADELKRGGHGGGVFEDWALYDMSSYGFHGTMRVLTMEDTGAHQLVHMHLKPCAVRHFVSAEHLAQLVAADLELGGLGMYIPMAQNDPLVDAWCTCTVDGKLVVVGLQMTVAKSNHTVAGEDEARKQFAAVHGSLAQHGVSVGTEAWVVFVVPAVNSSGFQYQFAKDSAGGKKLAGLVWPHTQAKLAVRVRPENTVIELSSAVSVEDLCTLHRVGQRRALQLLGALWDVERDESKTVDDFVEYLERCNKLLSRILQDDANVGRWTFRGRVPCIAPRPAKRARNGVWMGSMLTGRIGMKAR